MRTRNWLRSAVGVGSLLCASCLGGSGGGEAKSTKTEERTGATSGGSAQAPAERLVVWNGEEKATGKGWASCNKKGECQATLEPTPDVGQPGSALKFHAEGPDWIGMGWNWYGWHPDDAGDDISAYESLVFSIKVESKSPSQAPDPKTVEVWLSCSCKANQDDEKGTNHVKLAEYAKDFDDGQWHEVVIPLNDLYKDKGAKFDKSLAWEFDLGTWGAEPKHFDIYVDNIGFL